MQFKTRLMVIGLLMAMTPALNTGCGGAECGAGTTEKDGTCVPDTVCGDYTTLADGNCVLDASACTAGTTNVDGVCVPDTTVCEAGTTFDTATRSCKPNWDIACGTGTSYNADSGKCEPGSEACAAGAALDAQGRCAVTAMACADGSELDANTGKCVPAASACDTNTAFTNGECLPVASVCNTGTTFNQNTGTCLPDVTCKAGDLILNGECVPAREELATRVDLVEQENNDPRKGGTAESLTLKAKGEIAVFSGTINEPTDLDSDMEADQDWDVYSFAATAGQTFKLSLQPSPEAPLLSFVVMSEDGEWRRHGTFGLRGGSARSIVIPMDGTYHIAVAPVASFLADDPTPQGASDANYIGTIEEVDAPTPTDFDVTSGSLTGDLGGINDNLFKLTNVGSGYAYITTDSFGAGVKSGYVSIWADPTTFVGEYELKKGETLRVPVPAGDAYALFDWGMVSSDDTAFEVSISGLQYEDLGAINAGADKTSQQGLLAGGLGRYYTFNVQAGEVIELTQENGSAAAVQAELYDAAGELVYSSLAFAPGSDSTPGIAYINAPTGGDYVLFLTNPDAVNAVSNQTVTVKSITPIDLMTLNANDTIAQQNTNTVAPRRRVYYKATFAGPSTVAGTVDANDQGDPQLLAWDAAGGMAGRSVVAGNESYSFVLGAGSYIFAVEAGEEMNSGYNWTGTVTAKAEYEAEPNDAAGMATTLPMDTAYWGRTSAGDADHYKITLASALTASEVLLVQVQPELFGAHGKFSCTLRDSGGQVLAQTTDYPDSCGLFAGGLAAGDYTLEITSDLPAAMAYTVKAEKGAYTQEAEPNNDMMSATALPMLPGNFLGTIAATDTDADYFKFTVTKTYAVTMAGGEGVKVELDVPPFSQRAQGDFGFELYDNAGNLLRGRNTTLAFPLIPAGDYYIKVDRADSDAMLDSGYQLKISEETFGTSPQGGNTCAEASPIFASGVFAGNFVGASNDYTPGSFGSGCTGWGASGTDVVFSVNLGAGDNLDLSLAGDSDMSLYVITDCGDAQGSCVGGSDDGNPETVNYTATTAGLYYIIVDRYSSTAENNYELTVNVTPAAP